MPARMLSAVFALLLTLTGPVVAQHSPLGYAIDVTDRPRDLFQGHRVGQRADAGKRGLSVRRDRAGHLSGHGHRPVRAELRGVRRRRASRCRSSGCRSTNGSWRRATGTHHPLLGRGDLGHAGGRARDLPHVRHLDRAGPRADQSARGHRISHRHAGAADPAPDQVSGELEGGDRAPAGPQRCVPGGGLRSPGGFPDPARPAERGPHPGHRRAGGDLHLLQDRQDRSRPSCSAPWTACSRPRDDSSASCRWSATPSSIISRTTTRRGPGSTRSAPSTSLQEGEFTDSVGRFVTDIAAHEFFHIVTPLNIHSEIIEHFNFVTPVPSQHLWLYEGTTEWAAHAMQFRSVASRARKPIWRRSSRRCGSTAATTIRRTVSGSWPSPPTATRGRRSTATSTCAAR